MEFTYEIDPFNPLFVYFKATGKSDKGTVTFNWNFGRGNTDTGEEVNFRFDTFGEKNVYLIARNSTLNIEEYISKKIVLESPAIKDLKITHSRNKSNPLSATFRASGISDYDITYEWDFGDGIKRTGMTQTINFSEFGTKYITLTASIPSLNVKSTINSEFDLKQPTISKLNFTAFPDKKDTLDVYFVGSGTTDFGELEYKWDFGRGSSAEGSEASYKFKYYDTYPVKLTATIKGTQISASTTENVNVTENNSLAFDYSYNDDSTSDKFLETQFLPQLNINLTGINYEWNFGDAESGVVNNTSSEKQPIHKFTKSNKYVIMLTVTANELISPLVLKKNVYILEKPIASVWIDRHSRDALNGTRRFDIWVMDTWSHILDRTFISRQTA